MHLLSAGKQVNPFSRGCKLNWMELYHWVPPVVDYFSVYNVDSLKERHSHALPLPESLV